MRGRGYAAGAQAFYDRAIELRPNDALALTIDPNRSEVALNFGNALMRLSRCAEARTAYRRAIAKRCWPLTRRCESIPNHRRPENPCRRRPWPRRKAGALALNMIPGLTPVSMLRRSSPGAIWSSPATRSWRISLARSGLPARLLCGKSANGNEWRPATIALGIPPQRPAVPFRR